MAFWVQWCTACWSPRIPPSSFLLLRHSLLPFVPASLPLSASRPPLLFLPPCAFHPLCPLRLAAAAAELEAAQLEKLSGPAFSPPSIVAALFPPLHLPLPPPSSVMYRAKEGGRGVQRGSARHARHGEAAVREVRVGGPT